MARLRESTRVISEPVPVETDLSESADNDDIAAFSYKSWIDLGMPNPIGPRGSVPGGKVTEKRA